MVDPHCTSIQKYRDIGSPNAYIHLKEEGIPEEEILTILSQKSRDNSRTPIQWNQDENAGFTFSTLWIDLSNNIDAINVEDAMSNKDPVLHIYRQLIKLRYHYDITTYGDTEPLYMNHPQLFIYRRNYKNDFWLIIVNFSDKTVRIPDDLGIVGDIIIQSSIIFDNKTSSYGAVVIGKSY